VLSQVLILAFLLVFLAPFNYFVFFGPDSSEAPLFARGLIALFDLMDAPARYWELEVKADTPGLDFDRLGKGP
jgi:hypothetical protein